MAKKNILILGNGFDLALGLSTRYVDFVESSYWPIKKVDTVRYGEQNLYNFFYQYIQNHRDTLGRLRWIDLEDLIRQYALTKSSSPIKFESEKAIIEYDKEVFDNIKNSFIRYLVDVVERQRIGNSIAAQVIRQVAGNSTFKRVYSFNYTRTAEMLDGIGGWKPEVIHIHGRAFTYSNEIILGVGNSNGISKDYRFFLKYRQKGYLAHDLNEDLFEAKQVIFYGLSFGEADFVYFKRFFEETIRNHNSQRKKKIIHIFTDNDNSKASIADAFEDSGLPMNEVYSCIDIRFYVASDYGLSVNGFDAYDNFKQTMIETIPMADKLVAVEVNRFMNDNYK